MFGNLSPTSRGAIAAVISPASVAAGTVTTPFVSLATFKAMQALIVTGVLGAGATLDAKIEQAKDAAGTGVKDVVGTAIVQIVKATGDNKQVAINVRQRDVDKNNGFAFVRLSLTVGTSASLVSAVLLGFDPSYGAASVNQAASVAQTVN